MNKLVVKKFKLKSFLMVILLGGILLLSWRYCDLHDYANYFIFYYNGIRYGELLYSILQFVFCSLGFPFFVFYGVLISFVLVVNIRAITKNSTSWFFLFILYLICPYIYALQQIRFAVGSTIVLIGLLKYIENKKIHIFISYIVIATLFHVVCFFYISILILLKFDFKTLRFITASFLILGLFLINIIKTILAEIFSGIPFLTRYSFQLETFVSKTDLLYYVFFLFVFFLFDFKIAKRYYSFSLKTQTFISLAYCFFIFTVLRGLGNNAYRVYVYFMPVFYLSIINVAKETIDFETKVVGNFILLLVPFFCLLVDWGPWRPEYFERLTNEMWRVWSYFY